jgi:tetratricopeptide (TPR) repeat protein
MSAQNYSNLFQPVLAQANSEAAIEINPQSAYAYLILGQALEDQRDQVGAYQAYEKASALGNETEDPTITAQARMKLGILMQSMSMNNLSGDQTLTPTGTP